MSFVQDFCRITSRKKHLVMDWREKSVYIVSSHSAYYSRNELAMRNYLIASAAKENGAEFVALVEPDLFYSAQDRGPRTLDHPQVTDFASREKFVGQPCSAEMYFTTVKNIRSRLRDDCS
ncbi:MAG: hypothetical protein Ct9H300mP28_28860 [Pseudomonadota bacterium]|nr:MAG: hypothetical protein Ct9H300mP28_28860 [Pseudomonadota bacterium]